MQVDSIGAVQCKGTAAGIGRGKGRRAARDSGRATWKGAKGGADDSAQQAYVEINHRGLRARLYDPIEATAGEYAQLRGRAVAEHIYGGVVPM